jgi:hypothetical protein
MWTIVFTIINHACLLFDPFLSAARRGTAAFGLTPHADCFRLTAYSMARTPFLFRRRRKVSHKRFSFALLYFTFALFVHHRRRRSIQHDYNPQFLSHYLHGRWGYRQVSVHQAVHQFYLHYFVFWRRILSRRMCFKAGTPPTSGPRIFLKFLDSPMLRLYSLITMMLSLGLESLEGGSS